MPLPTRTIPPATQGKRSSGDRPPDRPVRHVFWKYPVLSAVMLVIVVAVAAIVGSPNWPRDTIASISQSDPGGSILAFTKELDGTSISTANANEYGMGDPAQIFVIGPLQQVQPLLNAPPLDSALQTYLAAISRQQLTWASNYDTALGTITPMSGGGSMATTPSPDFAKIATLQGDFGPVPMLTQYDLKLAQTGYLDQYLQALHSDHSLHMVNIWLYDHPAMLNTAIANGLTDDQWGMIKERGFPVGPWYLFLPAVIHVLVPNGSNGPGFVLDNLLLTLFFLFGVTLIPGLRDLPRRLKLYRFMYRYPTPGELEQPALAPHPAGYHGRDHEQPMPTAGGTVLYPSAQETSVEVQP